MPYRIEHARTGRATCSNKECKDAGRKIAKDEIRYGSWIDLGDHGSWSWRHWGCVTPAQVRNLSESISTNDDIDGWDEISPEAKDKLRLAIQEGHVADEDWNGDIECNRPGARGFRVKTPKKKAEPTDESAETPSKPKGKRSPKRKAEPEEEDVKPSRRKKVKAENDTEPAGGEDQPTKPPPKPKRSRKPKAEQDLTDSETKFVVPKEEEGESKKSLVKIEPNDNDDDEALLATAPKKAKPARSRKGRVKKEEDEADVEVKVPKQSRKVQKSKASDEIDGKVNGANGDTSQATGPENDSKVKIKKPKAQGRGRRAQQVKQEPVDDDHTTTSESDEKPDEQLNNQAEDPSSQDLADAKVKSAPAKKAHQKSLKESAKAISAASEHRAGALRRSSRKK